MDPAGQITPGLEVTGCDGVSIGHVKQVLEDGKTFRVDVHMAPDYYVPMSAIQELQEGTVVLKCTQRQAAYMGWELRPQER
jgi:hypothetical protein